MSVHVEVLDPGTEPPGGHMGQDHVCYVLNGSYPNLAYQHREHDWHPADLDAGLWYCSRCRRVERRTVEFTVEAQRYANPEDVPV